MLKAGFYEKQITPPLGCSMSGDFVPRYSEDVMDELYAKAVVISNDEEIVAILSVDATEIDAGIRQKVVERVTSFVDIKPENIVVHATHTHYSSPNTSGIAYEVQPLEIQHMAYFVLLLADAIILAYKRLKPVSIKYAKAYEDSISFNRNYKMKDGYIMSNPGFENPDIVEAHAGIDPEIPILFFEDENGKPVGLLWSFACHQCCGCIGPNNTKSYTGDFSCITAKNFKDDFGMDFVSIFFAGTCGNINHINPFSKPTPRDHYVKMGHILHEDIKKALETASVSQEDVLKVKTKLMSLKKGKLTETEIKEAHNIINELADKDVKYTVFDPQSDFLKLVFAKTKLAHAKKQDEDFKFQIQVIHIGDCNFYTMPGEIFVQFGLMVKEKSPSDKNFVVELCNDDIGYVPVRELLNEKRLYESSVGWSRMADIEAGYILVDELLKMANEI